MFVGQLRQINSRVDVIHCMAEIFDAQVLLCSSLKVSSETHYLKLFFVDNGFILVGS